MSILLQKSIDNTNTFTGNTFSTHSTITGAFKRRPSWLHFFFVSVVVNFNSALRFCMPHIFHLKLTKGPPIWVTIEQRQQSGLIFSLTMLAIRLSGVVVQIRNATHRQWHPYIVVKNVYHYDTHTTNVCPSFIKLQKIESSLTRRSVPGPHWGMGAPLPDPRYRLAFAHRPSLYKIRKSTPGIVMFSRLVVAMELSTDTY